jgi:hypothetical protein
MMKRTADVADLEYDKQQPLMKKYKSAKDDTECKVTTTTTRERVLKSKDTVLHTASFLLTHERIRFAIATGNKGECHRLLGGPESEAYWSTRVFLATKHVHRSLDELALTFLGSPNDWARKEFQPANRLWFVPEDILAARSHLLAILYRHSKDTAYEFVRKIYSGTFLDAEHDLEITQDLGFRSNAYEPKKTLAVPAIAHVGALADALSLNIGKRNADQFIGVFVDHFWPSKQGTCEQCHKSDVKLIRGNKGKWRCRLCRDACHYDDCTGDCDLKECPTCHECISYCQSGGIVCFACLNRDRRVQI